MRVQKKVLDETRLRQLPRQFSWIDQRLVQHHYLPRLSHRACALYLFLVVVGDERGLSFYSDTRIGRHLRVSDDELARARAELVALRLIAYTRPLYQVLALNPSAPPSESLHPVADTSPALAHNVSSLIESVLKRRCI